MINNEDDGPYSQPTLYEPSRLSRTLSGEQITRRREGMSSEKVEQKLQKFQEFKNYIQTVNRINGEYDDEDEYTADEVDTIDEQGNIIHFFYFIGRLNPPHNGHIKALRTLVEMANNVNSVPLILLGSGPKGERTLDNPIPFEIKEQFIRNVLQGNYIIEKMTNPAQNISKYIRDGLRSTGENISNISNIEITHIAGGKDEDTTKLNFALVSAEKTARSMVPEDVEVSTGVTAIEAEPTDGDIAMSATKVRKDTYKTLLDDSGFNGWSQDYKDFYGEMAQEIYNQILEPALNIPQEEELSYYIEHGEILKPAKRKRKGGNKRNTKNKRNRKTHKKQRKRRITRRRKY
jgi:nicotinamide mononucleotide adenylyltransferase